ncbi:hypothetical protein UlMin_026228 [Ulmus minor]
MGSSTSSWPESLIRKLVRGKEKTNQLREILLRKPTGSDGGVSAGELAGDILKSFVESLSELSSGNCSDQTSTDTVEVVSRIKSEPSNLDHSHCDDRSSEDSGQSKKRSLAILKDRRGCYKRRKSSQSCSRVSPIIEDGKAWRKYGQKEILNAKYPRAYFRCTQKYEQGCLATKQVQQIQENPPMYRLTYIGQHTCRSIQKAPQMIAGAAESEYYMNLTQNDQVGQELKEEEAPKSDVSSENNLCFDAAENTNLWCGLNGFGEFMSDDHNEGVISTLYPNNSHHFDMGSFLLRSLDCKCDDFAHFDETEHLLGSL